jgi:methylated-DNA-protein-cysteine methyltransferase related protein
VASDRRPKRAPTKEAAERAPPPRPAREQPARRGAPDEVRTVSWWDDFYRVIRRIPSGRVTTYGVVAALGGHPRAARHVGFALAALKDQAKLAAVPWQRVLGAAPGGRAHVTLRDPVGGAIQRAMLEAEGVTFDARGRVDLATFGWPGPRTPARRARSTAAAKRRLL